MVGDAGIEPRGHPLFADIPIVADEVGVEDERSEDVGDSAAFC